jgi:hypothetical protein
MPRYKTACFGEAPGVVLDASVEAVTPTAAAEASAKRWLPGRRVTATRGANINGMHYYTAADCADPQDVVIITAKEI